MAAAIIGLGSAFPAHRLNQAEAAHFATTLSCRTPEEERVLEKIFVKAQVESRGSVLIEPDASGHKMAGFFKTDDGRMRGPTTAERMSRFAKDISPLAREASLKALSDAGVQADQVTHLVVVSCTGFYAPGLDADLIESLQLRRDITRTMIGFMGCHGALNGLQVARAFVEADPQARVLLCAAELCSLHFQYGWSSDNVIANALFADGAAAAVIGDHDATQNGRTRYCIAAAGSLLMPESKDAMSWTIGDQGFAMTLSRRIPELIAAHLPDWIHNWLKSENFDPEQIKSWAVHPGGPRILNAVEQTLKLPPEALMPSRKVLAEHGNMSSPTLLVILENLRNARAPAPIVLLGFGPGLVVEAVLLKTI